MKIPPSVSSFLFGLFVILPSSTKGADDNLHGRWNIVSVPSGWKKIPGTSVVIAAGEVKICVGTLTTSTLSYRVDAATGKVDARRKVGGKTVVQHGIYCLKGDTLTVSVGKEGEPAPASPDDTNGGAMHWILQRAG